MLVAVVNIAFVGHLGNTTMLAGVGLGTIYASIFCQTIIFGLNGAIQTLVSNASGNLKECGEILNRGRFVAIIAFIPITIALCLSEKFLLAIGMDAEVSSYATFYV